MSLFVKNINLKIGKFRIGYWIIIKFFFYVHPANARSFLLIFLIWLASFD